MIGGTGGLAAGSDRRTAGGGQVWTAAAGLAFLLAFLHLAWVVYGVIDGFGVGDLFKGIVYSTAKYGALTDLLSPAYAVVFVVAGVLALKRRPVARGILIGVGAIEAYQRFRLAVGALAESEQRTFFLHGASGVLRLITYFVALLAAAAVVVLLALRARGAERGAAAAPSPAAAGQPPAFAGAFAQPPAPGFPAPAPAAPQEAPAPSLDKPAAPVDPRALPDPRTPAPAPSPAPAPAPAPSPAPAAEAPAPAPAPVDPTARQAVPQLSPEQLNRDPRQRPQNDDTYHWKLDGAAEPRPADPSAQPPRRPRPEETTSFLIADPEGEEGPEAAPAEEGPRAAPDPRYTGEQPKVPFSAAAERGAADTSTFMFPRAGQQHGGGPAPADTPPSDTPPADAPPAAPGPEAVGPTPPEIRDLLSPLRRDPAPTDEPPSDQPPSA